MIVSIFMMLVFAMSHNVPAAWRSSGYVNDYFLVI
jgi:hypothetical protein